MREIKFRGIREKTGEWVYGYLVKREEPFLHDIVSPIGNQSSCTWAIKRGSEGQYTGLKDSEGNEIFEGDILQMWEKTVNGTKLTHICKVYQHENGKWMMEGHLESDGRYRTRLEVYSHRKMAEIVGNIYEYPELIKEG